MQFQMFNNIFIYILAVYFDRNSTLAFVAAMMICVQCYCLYNLPNLVSMRGTVRCALRAFLLFYAKNMPSLSAEYLINVKMVKLPGDDSKYVMMTVFRFF